MHNKEREKKRDGLHLLSRDERNKLICGLLIYSEEGREVGGASEQGRHTAKRLGVEPATTAGLQDDSVHGLTA